MDNTLLIPVVMLALALVLSIGLAAYYRNENIRHKRLIVGVLSDFPNMTGQQKTKIGYLKGDLINPTDFGLLEGQDVYPYPEEKTT